LGGERLAALFSDELAPASKALEKTVTSREPTRDTRLEVALSNSHPKVLRVSTAPLVDEGGAVLVVRDTTRLSRLEEQLGETQGYHGIIGRSPKMQQVFDLIENVKDTDSTVLICGESGTGKEGIAAAIQKLSPRADGPYIKVNCAALSEEVLESELFGHVRGAFTGAVKDRIGRFEAADGGTILLDEIGDVSLKVQLKLLRVLQEREFERVGDTKPLRTDVRVIVTTNQDLVEKIQIGDFRQDLYYRLNVVRIEAHDV
jgi:transcriptional regulator with GAF, ATPase, and Fis domain